MVKSQYLIDFQGVQISNGFGVTQKGPHSETKTKICRIGGSALSFKWIIQPPGFIVIGESDSLLQDIVNEENRLIIKTIQLDE